METATERKTRVTNIDCAMVYLVQGLPAVEPLLVGHSDPVGTLDKTIDRIHSLDPSRDTADLENLRDKFAAAKGSGQRGRARLEDVGSRLYRAQQVNDGDLFIRLPVSMLVSNKGDHVLVEAKTNKKTGLTEYVIRAGG